MKQEVYCSAQKLNQNDKDHKSNEMQSRVAGSSHYYVLAKINGSIRTLDDRVPPLPSHELGSPSSRKFMQKLLF